MAAVADADVGSAGDELLGAAVAILDGGQLELVGVGMLLDLDDLGDDNLVAIPDGPFLLGLDAQAVGAGQAKQRTPATSRPASVRRCTRSAAGMSAGT